jgi:phosphate transport system substrate-binding protein
VYSTWIAAFQQREPDITLTYASIGSSAGIADISAGRTDFGASDAPMSEEQLNLDPLPTCPQAPTVALGQRLALARRELSAFS